ncbi:hypothetical protein [Spirochaeta dissipatitropha]
MSRKKTVNIYHVHRSNGKSIFLDPFHDPDALIEHLSNSEIEGYYGKEPSVDDVLQYREFLYRRLDAAVKRHVRERMFIPKFLAASFVFMLIFFFTSLIILTPVPLLDEIIISTAAAVFTFIALGRAQNTSEKVHRKRLELRQNADKIRFSELPGLVVIEDMIANLEDSSPEQQLQQWQQLREHYDIPLENADIYRDIAAQMIKQTTKGKQLDRLLSDMQESSPGALELILDRARNMKNDVPLLIVSDILKKKSAIPERF